MESECKFLPLYSGETLIGDLVDTDGGIKFEINPLAAGFLPARPDEMVTFVENLLPEGKRDEWYKAMRRLKRNDMIGYLQDFGEDLAGNLSGGPPEGADGKGEPIDATKAISELVFERAPLDATVRGQKSLLAGADPKLAIILDNGRFLMPDAAHPSTHIIKYNNQLCLNEHFCMTLMDRMGIRTAKTELLCVCGQEVLLVERFDRERGRKLAAADFCQICNRSSGDKYRIGYRDMRSGFDRMGLGETDRETFLAASFFNMIMGCSDDHAKNFSVLFSGDGNRVPADCRLAPMYDVASMKVAKECSAVYRKLDTGMAKPVDGQHDAHKLKPVHILNLGKLFGIGRERTAGIFHKVYSGVAEHGPALLREFAEKDRHGGYDPQNSLLHGRFFEKMPRFIEKELRFFAGMDDRMLAESEPARERDSLRM